MNNNNPAAHAGPRFFGRRKGHTLSLARKNALATALPFLLIEEKELANFLSWIEASHEPVWMEIGCGTGENLLSWMKREKSVRYIAVEPFYNGVAAFVKNILPEDYHRLRIYPDVVHTLLPLIPPKSLQRIYLLFPDPWPKSRHHKRRLLQRDFLCTLSGTLKKDAELWIATDSGDLMLFMLEELEAVHGFSWQEGARLSSPMADWPEWVPHDLSRYGQKALKDGRRNTYTVWAYAGEVS